MFFAKSLSEYHSSVMSLSAGTPLIPGKLASTAIRCDGCWLPWMMNSPPSILM